MFYFNFKISINNKKIKKKNKKKNSFTLYSKVLFIIIKKISISIFILNIFFYISWTNKKVKKEKIIKE